MNRYFFKENILSVHKDLQRFTMSLVIKEIKMKLAIRYAIPTKMVKSKLQTVTSADKNVEKLFWLLFFCCDKTP